MSELPMPQFAAADHFFNTSLETLLAACTDHVLLEGNMLALFKRCAQQVPAYADYLLANGLDPQSVQSFSDWLKIPLQTKAAYMRHYPLSARCLGGGLQAADRIAVSSGSTGEPMFWPRSVADEFAIAVRFEQVFHDSFQAHERKTLAVVCFALGNWVGGVFTTSCCWHLAQKGYSILVATPGNNKAEILRVVRELAPSFEQTVLLGYPPFVKDVIDTGLAEGIDWQAHHTKLVFAGEVFSEEWRNLLAARIGSTAPCFDFASLYGTADGGVLGNETPLSIAVRRWLAKHPAIAHALFGESRLPTLVQYDPLSRFFEVFEQTLVVTGDSTVPLLRYHIADKGGLLSYTALLAILQEHGVSDWQSLGLPADFKPRELPFVYVFGRADFTVSFYGANIYPENIAVGLEQVSVSDWVSGKFVLEVLEKENGDKVLHIVVELLPGISPDSNMIPVLATSIHQQLLRLNSEFAHYTPPERQMPHIGLRVFADPEYFLLGIKHRYTR